MSSKPENIINDIETYLERQKKETLIALLMEQVRGDDRLCERLMVKAAREEGKRLDPEPFRRALFSAIAPDEFISYREMWDYASRIEEVIKSVRGLLAEGFANEVIDLAEYALELIEDAMHSVDDSGGEMSMFLQELQELHYEACVQARPDPEELAIRLFTWEMESEWETFLGASAHYEEVLGSAGLAKYRALAEAEWARLPALRAGGEDDSSGRRYRLTRLMESFAMETNDLDAWVGVLSRNLSRASHYLRIAELFRHAGKDEQALEWAERGLQAFPKDTDSRLLDFLAEEYHRRGRHDDAMRLIWDEFAESKIHYLSACQKLKRHADRFGAWPEWREKAIRFVRERTEWAKKNAPRLRWQWGQIDNSEMVRFFLWEEDVEAAWREAKEGGCADDLWVQLAGLREQDHPEDALEIYQRQIEPLVAQKNNQSYEEAVAFLGKVRGLMTRLRRESEFDAYLAGLRKAHKPKRNFMALLDRME